ncbi:MAG: hypothetical protein J6N22_06615 [Schwartzia sp.]|nr:hypothetical protein [Schwartzia sp. (in: firmicutes)]MBP3691121.1 hypothetical protein [Schwartzia sp. (in: firmicutes)]
MNFSNIDKQYIRDHTFSSDGLTFPVEHNTATAMLRPGDSGIPLPSEKKQVLLQREFSRIFAAPTPYNGNFAKLETRTGLTEAIMRKYLRGARPITRVAVAKLCVGTPLTLEQSIPLFSMQGHSLDPEEQLFDAIVVDAINCGDDIGTFYESCASFGIQLNK